MDHVSEIKIIYLLLYTYILKYVLVLRIPKYRYAAVNINLNPPRARIKLAASRHLLIAKTILT